MSTVESEPMKGPMSEDPHQAPADLTRAALQLVVLGALIAAIFRIIEPFLVAILWGSIVAIATWPVLIRAESILWGKRTLAAGLMTLILAAILIAPFYFAIAAIANNIEQIADWSKQLATLHLPHPPSWLPSIPLIGGSLSDQWQQIANAGPKALAAELSPLAHQTARWFVSHVGSLGILLVQLLLTVIITAIIYGQGEAAGEIVTKLVARLAGPGGEKMALIAAQAIRSVAVGIVVTAVLQSVLAGIGLAITHVPFVIPLTALMFVLAVAQIGAAPVLAGAVIWVYANNGVMWGTGLLVWSILCVVMDNFVRPVLIKRGAADIPLILIFAGVIGGLITFGVIGLFIGPAVLAVANALLNDWLELDAA